MVSWGQFLCIFGAVSERSILFQWSSYSCVRITFFLKKLIRTSLVGRVVKTPCFKCRGCTFDPWSGTKIPHGTQWGQKKREGPGLGVSDVEPFCLVPQAPCHSQWAHVLHCASSSAVLGSGGGCPHHKGLWWRFLSC